MTRHINGLLQAFKDEQHIFKNIVFSALAKWKHSSLSKALRAWAHWGANEMHKAQQNHAAMVHCYKLVLTGRFWHWKWCTARRKEIQILFSIFHGTHNTIGIINNYYFPKK
jgi:hypothetical protein